MARWARGAVPPLLALGSLLAGAMTEAVARQGGVPDDSPLRGGTARAQQRVTLVPPRTIDDGLALQTFSVRGSSTTVDVLVDANSGGEGLGEDDPKAPLQTAQLVGPALSQPDESSAAVLACSGLLQDVPSRGTALADDAEEGDALLGACRVAAGAPLQKARQDLTFGPAEAARFDELTAAVAQPAPPAGGRAPRITWVQYLEARVVPGHATRAAVAVALRRADGGPAAGQLVQASYPGGSVAGRTGDDGSARLDIPDLDTEEALPLVVSWRGALPAGTPLGGDLQANPALPDLSPPHAWLRRPLAFSLRVTVFRDAG